MKQLAKNNRSSFTMSYLEKSTNAQDVTAPRGSINSNKRATRFMKYSGQLKRNMEDTLFSRNSSAVCPHRYRCYHNALYKGFFRSFTLAYCIKTAINIVRIMFGKGGLSIEVLRNIFRATETFRFALWLGLQSCFYKLTLCALRNISGKTHPAMNCIAGFVGAQFILVDVPKRLKQVALFCTVRALSDYLLSIDLPKIRGTSVVAFALTQAPITYCVLLRPGLLNRGYERWIQRIGGLYADEKIFYDVIASSDLPIKSCADVVHRGKDCARMHTIEWLTGGLTRAIKMYLPVHFVPGILFRPKSVVHHPLRFLYRKSLNTLRSSLFLSTYAYIMRMSLCYGRKIMQRNSHPLTVVIGFLSGLSIIIEHPGRRIELLLYTLPRALEAIGRGISRETVVGRLVRWKWLSLFLYQFSVALWMYTIARNGWSNKLNSLNMTIIKIFFGSEH